LHGEKQADRKCKVELFHYDAAYYSEAAAAAS
jgi:hypothetical protein